MKAIPVRKTLRHNASDAALRRQLEEGLLKLEKEKHARERWWQEDNLVNQRLNWLLTSQSLIGAGYGFLITKISTEACSMTTQELHLFIQISRGGPMLGFLLSCFLLAGLHAALQAQKELQLLNPNIRLGVSNRTTWLGHATARGVPFLFATVWAFAFFAVDLSSAPNGRQCGDLNVNQTKPVPVRHAEAPNCSARAPYSVKILN